MQHQGEQRTIKTLVIILILIEIVLASVQLETKLQLASKRAYFSTVQAGNKIFFIGGYEHSDYVASDVIDVLDLASSSFETPLNLSTPRGRISSIVIGPKIYMVGGISYSCLPFTYSSENNNFSTSGFTSGPTVRRPICMALHDSTLTVIGAYSVDFMNTTTKQWTHNSQLTRVMSQVFDTTTISHHNSVFVVGGKNATSQQELTSVWVLDSPSSTPEESHDKVAPVSSSMFVGSWFDEDNSAVVIQFSNQCLVYHTSSRTWLRRDTNNNSVSSVSFQNSTKVFFTDGYWTIDWHHMNDTWTSLDQINIAFTVGDQLVFSSGQQMTIMTNDTSVTQSVDIGPLALSMQMSSSHFLLVNTSSSMFVYDASTKQLNPVYSALRFVPVSIFRGNNSQVYVIGALQGATLQSVFITVQPDSSFQTLVSTLFPQVLIGNNFFNLTNGTWAAADSPYDVRSFDQTFPTAIWTQQGDEFYLMQTSSFTSSPNALSQYNAVDVYNYVRGEWESSIPMTDIPVLVNKYFPVVEFDGVLHVFVRNIVFQLNATGDWNRKSVGASNLAASLTHPTYVPVPVIDNTAYVLDAGTGLLTSTPDMRVQAILTGLVGLSQQLVSTNTQVIQSIVVNSNYSLIATYDIPSNSWRGVQFVPPQSMVSIAVYDGVVLALGDDTESLSYLNVTSDQWTSEPFDNAHVPASMFTLQLSNYNRTVLVIAGGYHRTSRHYTDEVKFITIDIESPPLEASPSTTITTPLSPQQTDSSATSTIVIAAIVPVVIVAIAAVVLAILLVRRKRQRRRTQSASTTIGLEQQFGEWFVPFSDIHFGAQLGQGANGQVFKGKWKNTEVALKVSMTQANQSVISELSLMINMRPHPNVVQLFGFSVHPEANSVILILEYCNGGSLDKQLMDKNASEIPINQRLQLLQGIARGVVHLHSNNIVHRDLAARNVLLHQGEPKLTDFGMSRIVDDQQQRGTTKSELGPIRWMSPESLGSKQYSTKSDVWSFGILMFEVLAQQEPHLDEDPIEVGRKIRDEGLTPQLPSSLECLSDFTSIMNHCCAFDPNYRPSIEQVLQKLEQIPL